MFNQPISPIKALDNHPLVNQPPINMSLLLIASDHLVFNQSESDQSLVHQSLSNQSTLFNMPHLYTTSICLVLNNSASDQSTSNQSVFNQSGSNQSASNQSVSNQSTLIF